MTNANGQSVQSRRLQALIRYWNEKRGQRSMPSREDIDPAEIPRLLPIVLLAEIVAGQSRIRLLGSEATEAYGAETRGKFVHEFQLGEFTPFWADSFLRAPSASEPIVIAGSFTRNDQHCAVEAVLAPLSRDGVAASHIFGGLLIKPVSRRTMSLPNAEILSITREPTEYPPDARSIG